MAKRKTSFQLAAKYAEEAIGWFDGADHIERETFRQWIFVGFLRGYRAAERRLGLRVKSRKKGDNE